VLSVALRRIAECLRHRNDYGVRGVRLVAGLVYLVEYTIRMTLFGVQIRRRPTPLAGSPEMFTLIIPTRHRLDNLQPIVRAALQLACVERVIVVNANPDERIAAWLPADHRVVAIDDAASKVGVRFSVARQYPARYYLTVDDDILLRPGQLSRLFQRLLETPAAIHGILGERYTGGADPFEHGIMRRQAEVDLLNSVHAFTSTHVEQYHRLLGTLGLPESREIQNGEDILLAGVSSGKPQVHDVGRWIMCPSTIDRRVALHQRPGFRAERADLFLRVRAATSSRG